jgi:NAD-dependent SIR2 family protein deacetylase
MPSKDYDHIITILTKEILKKRLAVFIGAGCSIASGLPSWKQLIENLVAKYGIQTKEVNPLKLASRIERSIGHGNFVDEISETCRASQMRGSATHELLTELDINLYITTNYDHLLEEAFRKKGIEPHVVYTDLDLGNLNPTAKTIVKLHGDIDVPSSMVCTESDYRQYKTRHRGFTDWLKAKDTELTIFFLGTSVLLQ